MGNLYWLSLANSFMDYDWCNLLKCNHFQHGVTVLWPECYTLEVRLRTIDTVYNTIQHNYGNRDHAEAIPHLLRAKNGKIYSHSMCHHLVRLRPWKCEWESCSQRHRRLLCMLSLQIQVTWPPHGFLSSLQTEITSMAESKVDPSILSNMSLWHQNPKVSKLFYSLLGDSGHP